jgi:hypothetical protein
MSKARDLANYMSTGGELADGNISVSEINDLTATAAELNKLDGFTGAVADLNILDGVTSTTAELNHVDGVTSNVQTQIDAKQPYATIAVTVVNSGGNKYALDGTVQQLALLTPSVTYRFDQSDSSNAGHPLLFSTTSNGTHGGGSAFTTGVTSVGTPGSAGSYTQIKLEQDTPSTLYYYCVNHSGMGGEANKTISKLSDLGVTSTSTELNLLDGVNSTTAELNILSGVTATATELNTLDGIPATLTATELGYVDGVTSAIQTQLDAKQALDAELTELATMGSTTASALADLTQAEVQILDGATVTTTELNYVDGVTSAIQTQLDTKAPTASPTLTGTATINGTLDIEEVYEKVTTQTTTTGTITFDTTTQAIEFYTANQTANRTINFSNVNSNLAIGQSMTSAVLMTQGSTAYYLNAYQVDGSSVTPKWQGGSAPTEGNASGIDAYSFTIIKTADATFTVFASIIQYA